MVDFIDYAGITVLRSVMPASDRPHVCVTFIPRMGPQSLRTLFFDFLYVGLLQAYVVLIDYWIVDIQIPEVSYKFTMN